MKEPQPRHRAWAEIVRTAAAIATLCLTAGLFAEKVGWW